MTASEGSVELPPTFAFGSVILVPFPFTNQMTVKRRPAVIISSLDYAVDRPDIILMAITSQLRKTSHPHAAITGFEIEKWQLAGLPKASAVKPVIATVEQNLIIKQLGLLNLGDRISLKRLTDQIIGKA